MRPTRLLATSLSILSFAVLAQPPFGGPPPGARTACQGRTDGSPCRFSAPHGQVSGTCRSIPEGKACVPAGHRPQGRAPGGGMPPPNGGRDPFPHGTDIAADNPAARRVRSRLPDTGQGSCFDDRGPIACPRDGQTYAGQDAQYLGAKPNYRDNGDGTVDDLVTGLTWQQGHNAQRLGWHEARQACAGLTLGGHRDWRLPSIRELFSIADFRGSVGRRPYLDRVFEIREPDASILADDPFAASHHTDRWARPGRRRCIRATIGDDRASRLPSS